MISDWEYEPPPDKNNLAVEVRKILNRCYMDQSPGPMSFRTYRAVWESPEFHGLTLAEFREMLRNGEAMNAHEIGPTRLEQLRLAFGVRPKYKKVKR